MSTPLQLNLTDDENKSHVLILEHEAPGIITVSLKDHDKGLKRRAFAHHLLNDLQLTLSQDEFMTQLERIAKFMMAGELGTGDTFKAIKCLDKQHLHLHSHTHELDRYFNNPEGRGIGGIFDYMPDIPPFGLKHDTTEDFVQHFGVAKTVFMFCIFKEWHCSIMLHDLTDKPNLWEVSYNECGYEGDKMESHVQLYIPFDTFNDACNMLREVANYDNRPFTHVEFIEFMVAKLNHDYRVKVLDKCGFDRSGWSKLIIVPHKEYDNQCHVQGFDSNGLLVYYAHLIIFKSQQFVRPLLERAIGIEPTTNSLEG